MVNVNVLISANSAVLKLLARYDMKPEECQQVILSVMLLFANGMKPDEFIDYVNDLLVLNRRQISGSVSREMMDKIRNTLALYDEPV